MELRRILKKRRKNRKTGTLTCSCCHSTNHFVLWEGRRCRRCHVPKAINPDYIAHPLHRAIDPRIQTPETLALKARCDALMAEHGFKRFRFSGLIGCVQSGFDAWYQGKYGVVGQERMMVRISDGIDAWLGGLESSPATTEEANA